MTTDNKAREAAGLPNDDTKKSVNYVLIALQAIRDREGNKRGVTGFITCPKCGGQLGYSIAKCNGDVWGKCETGDVAWMM